MSSTQIQKIERELARGHALLETVNRNIRSRVITMILSVLFVILSFRLAGYLRAIPLIINAIYFAWAWRSLMALSETKREISTGMAVHRQNLKKLKM